MQKVNAVALLTLLTVGWTLGQIHFTPDWGNPGKRSLSSLLEEDSTFNSNSCLEQTDLRLLMDIAKILTKEAKRLSSCLKECPSL